MRLRHCGEAGTWVATLLLSALPLAGSARAATALRVQAATSLGPAFEELSRAFEAANPGVFVESETGASLLLARRLMDLDARVDVIAVADIEVFDDLLIPAKAISVYRTLCGNGLGILYTPRSKHAADLGRAPWWEVLARSGVRVGRADPDAAPAGYRTLMLLRLAERRESRPGLAERLAKASEANVRTSLSQLAALVEAGELDYSFDYRSSAEARGLSFFALPPEIDFSDPRRASAYAEATMEVRGARPDSRLKVVGSPIRYGIAVPKASAHPDLAAAFVELVMGQKGRDVLTRRGFVVFPKP